FAFPSTRVPSVLFTDPALELLSAREQAAVFAHEVAHLEHYDRRRCRIVSAITYGLVATATLGAAPALARVPAGLCLPVWSPGRDGVWWVEARDPAERDPETLRQMARSRWSVPYDELVELRVRAFWWGGGASLVARDRSGSSRAVQIAPTEVEALQRKLDAVEHRLAHDTLVTEPPAVVGRFTAMALGVVVVFVEGLLSLGLITGFVAIIRPSRAALAAVAGVAGACLLVFAGDLGVRSPNRPTLAHAAPAGRVCAMAAGLARPPRTLLGRPGDYLPTMGALVPVVALTWRS